MEALKGGDLKDFILKRKKEEVITTEEEVKDIMQQILKALKYMHVHKGIMHRDLKPENIMLMRQKPKDSNIVVKLADFGQAATNNKNEIGTKQTATVGTKIYMAPEMFFTKEYNHKIDMFSAGCILYNLQSNGKHPFYKSGDDCEAILNNLKIKELNFDELENVSDQAKDLLKRLLEKNPDYRYSAGESLNHPWITGAELNERPFTPVELMEMYMIRLQLQQVCRIALFTNYVKKKYNETYNKKTQISRLNQMNDFKKCNKSRASVKSDLNSENYSDKFIYNSPQVPSLDVDSLYRKSINTNINLKLSEIDSPKIRPIKIQNTSSEFTESMYNSPNKKQDNLVIHKLNNSVSAINLNEKSSNLKGSRSAKNFYSILHNKKSLTTSAKNVKSRGFSSFYVDAKNIVKQSNLTSSDKNIPETIDDQQPETNDMFNKTYNELQYLDKENFKQRTQNNLERKRMFGSMAVFSKPPILPHIKNGVHNTNEKIKIPSGRNSVASYKQLSKKSITSQENNKNLSQINESGSQKAVYKLTKNTIDLRAKKTTNFNKIYSHEEISGQTKSVNHVFPSIEDHPNCSNINNSIREQESVEGKKSEKKVEFQKSYSKKVIFFADGNTKPGVNFSQTLNKAFGLKKDPIRSTPKLLLPTKDDPVTLDSIGYQNKLYKQMSKSVGKIMLEEENDLAEIKQTQAKNKSKFNEALLNNKKNQNVRLQKGPTDGTLILRIDKNKKKD